MWFLVGSQAFDQWICCFGPGSQGQGVDFGPELPVACWSSCFGPLSCGPQGHPFGPVVGAASLCSGCAPTQGFKCGHPTGVSGVGPQSANLGAGNWASGEHQACLSCVHSPGAEGGGVPEATVAPQSSLISC